MSAEERQAIVGMGSNLGDRAAIMSAAVERLGAWPRIRLLARSSVYETDPVSNIDQPVFLNRVIAVATGLSPEELLAALIGIEREFGRVRDVRWGPRTLDLDLLAYEGEIRASPSLTLPHPRMMERAFVVVPLRELLSRPALRISVWDGLRAKLTIPLETDGVRTYRSDDT